MNRKIIVTGGCGYIGSHTVIQLIENQFEVVVLDNLSNSSEATLGRIKQITGKQPLFIKVDLSNSEVTSKIFKRHNDALAVIHFAALKAVGESINIPLKYYHNNLNCLLNILNSQTENGINKLIFSSSATVYGTPDELPITEKSITKKPSSPYGNTKKIGEEIIEDHCKTESNFSSISLRYFNPIGAHGSGIIGELPKGIPNNLMPYITQTAAGILDKLEVFGGDYPTQDGTAIRDYVHVVDLAQAHIYAIKRLLNQEQEASFETFNLGSNKGYSVLEMIQTFETVSKVKLNYEITERRTGDISQLYASTKLAEEKLGWKAQRTIEEMILSSWKWEKNLLSQKNRNSIEKSNIA